RAREPAAERRAAVVPGQTTSAAAYNSPSPKKGRDLTSGVRLEQLLDRRPELLEVTWFLEPRILGLVQEPPCDRRKHASRQKDHPILLVRSEPDEGSVKLVTPELGHHQITNDHIEALARLKACERRLRGGFDGHRVVARQEAAQRAGDRGVVVDHEDRA